MPDFCLTPPVMVNMDTDNAIAVILAAGYGQRIGSPKWRLRFSADQSFLERLAEVYSLPAISHVVMVVNHRHSREIAGLPLPAKAIITVNNAPDLGRNHSIRLGLESVGKYDFAFIQNIDNPFTSDVLIARLWNSRQADGVVIPTYQQRAGHPVLIGRQLCHHLLQQPPAAFHFREWLSGQRNILVETDDASVLTNINTPEDLEKAQPFFPTSCYELKPTNLR